MQFITYYPNNHLFCHSITPAGIPFAPTGSQGIIRMEQNPNLLLIFMLGAGLLLLLSGRRLVYGFVTLSGFLFGWLLVAQFAAEQPFWARLAAGAAMGVLFSYLLSHMFRLAVILASFPTLGGAMLILARVYHLPLPPNLTALGVFLLGGAIAALFTALAYDWALSLLSALCGAALILWAVTGHLPLPPLPASAGVAMLTLLGALVQMSNLRRSKVI